MISNQKQNRQNYNWIMFIEIHNSNLPPCNQQNNVEEMEDEETDTVSRIDIKYDAFQYTRV